MYRKESTFVESELKMANWFRMSDEIIIILWIQMGVVLGYSYESRKQQ